MNKKSDNQSTTGELGAEVASKPENNRKFSGDVGIGLSNEQHLFVVKHPVGSVVFLGDKGAAKKSNRGISDVKQIAGCNDAGW